MVCEMPIAVEKKDETPTPRRRSRRSKAKADEADEESGWRSADVCLW